MITVDDKPIFQAQATITALYPLSPGYYFLAMHAPEIARSARPGQFVQLRPARAGVPDPLLARPISILGASRETGELTFLFKVVGRGTAMLAAYTPGEMLAALGPVGNGFTVPEEATSIALIAGGVGMPPLYFLAERLRQARPQLDIALYYGGRTSADLLMLPQWEALGASLFLATDDGSAGHHGLVTEPLQRRIHQQVVGYLAACGPRPMLRAVQRIALAAGLPGQLSLEARMACGVGACLGCACGTISGYRRVCIDGPVFALDEVTFDV